MKIINPLSGRYIQLGGATYRKLVRQYGGDDVVSLLGFYQNELDKIVLEKEYFVILDKNGAKLKIPREGSWWIHDKDDKKISLYWPGTNEWREAFDREK